MRYLLIVILSLTLSLTACDRKAKPKPQQEATAAATEVVKDTSASTQLFFSGSIMPLTMSNVIAPADGTVSSMGFHFGEKITKGQLLFTLTSTKAQEDFRTAVTSYLKEKDTYANQKASFAGQVELNKDGLVARNDFETARSALESEALSYQQALYQLLQVVNKLKGETAVDPKLLNSLTSLSLGDKRVSDILKMKFDRLTIHAPQNGVALFSTKGGGGGDSGGGSDGSTQLTVGSSIKEGQVLVTVGDLTGLSLQINVSEIDVNKVKPGMHAIITGAAFPAITLQGKVTSVASQAMSSAGGGDGQPSFPVTVIVPNLTAAQLQVIHVGMSAQVELQSENPPKIYVPLTAVKLQDGVSTIKVIDPVSGKAHPVVVTTGETTMDTVAIVKGLKAGDKIATHY